MNTQTSDRRLDSVWWALRIGLGLGPFLAGLDKFFNLLADWGMYLSPLATRALPVSGPTFMRVVGVIEMIVGLAILTRWTRLGAWVAMGWLVAIAINLVTTGMFFDLAVRDLEIAIAAYALARLTEIREASSETSGRRENEGRLDMKKVLAVVAAAVLFPLVLQAETWKNASLMDTMCAAKDAMKADPDSHPAKCAVQCQGSGYGVLTADGSFLKFDKAGNDQAIAALKATKKTDHLRVTVEGDRKGNEIQVKSLVFD